MIKEVRVTYFSYGDDEVLFDKKYNNIEEAEKAIGEGYMKGGFSYEEGETSVFIDGEMGDFELIAKIKIEEVKK